MCCGYCSYPPPPYGGTLLATPKKRHFTCLHTFVLLNGPAVLHALLGLCLVQLLLLRIKFRPNSDDLLSLPSWKKKFYFLNFKGMGKRGPRDIFFGDRKIINKTKNYKNWIKLPIKKRGDMTSEAIIRLLKIYLSLKNLEKSIKSKFFVILLKSLQFL